MGQFDSPLFIKKEQTRGRDMSKGAEVRLFFMEKPMSLSIEKEAKRDKRTGRSSLEIQININLCLFLISWADFLISGSSSVCDGSEARSSPSHDVAIFNARPPEMLQKGKARSLDCALGFTTGVRVGSITGFFDWSRVTILSWEVAAFTVLWPRRAGFCWRVFHLWPLVLLGNWLLQPHVWKTWRTHHSVVLGSEVS